VNLKPAPKPFEPHNASGTSQLILYPAGCPRACYTAALAPSQSELVQQHCRKYRTEAGAPLVTWRRERRHVCRESIRNSLPYSIASLKSAVLSACHAAELSSSAAAGAWHVGHKNESLDIVLRRRLHRRHTFSESCGCCAWCDACSNTRSCFSSSAFAWGEASNLEIQNDRARIRPALRVLFPAVSSPRRGTLPPSGALGLAGTRPPPPSY
jgi:hypothetical protein